MQHWQVLNVTPMAEVCEYTLNLSSAIIWCHILSSAWKSFAGPGKQKNADVERQRNNMPFHSNTWLTREKEILYGTRPKKNATDNLYTVMLPTKCQTLSAFCSVKHCLQPCCIGWVELYKRYPGVKFIVSNSITITCLSYSPILLIDTVTSCVGDIRSGRRCSLSVLIIWLWILE